MMRFDSATSSLLALLINKSYKKTEKAKIKKVFSFAVQKSLKTFLAPKVLYSNPSPRLSLTIKNIEKFWKQLQILTKYC